MTVNLMPITIPLPFFSYGGSSSLSALSPSAWPFGGLDSRQSGLSRDVNGLNLGVWRLGPDARNSIGSGTEVPFTRRRTHDPMAVIAWFKKERKPRTIPSDGWKFRPMPGRNAMAAVPLDIPREIREVFNVVPRVRAAPPDRRGGLHRAADRSGTWRSSGGIALVRSAPFRQLRRAADRGARRCEADASNVGTAPGWTACRQSGRHEFHPLHWPDRCSVSGRSRGGCAPIAREKSPLVPGLASGGARMRKACSPTCR